MTEKIEYKRYLPEDSSEDDDDDDDDIEYENEESYNKSKEKKRQKRRKRPAKKEQYEEEEENKAEEEPELPNECVLSDIKNRERRSAKFRTMKRQRKKAKKELKQLDIRESEILGKKLRKKQPHTIESKRKIDIPVPENDDEELIAEEETDKFSDYYAKKYEPKVLITSSGKIHEKTIKFMREFGMSIPNSTVVDRNRASVQKVVAQARKNGYTDVLIANEDRRVPNGLLVIHLPEGPTAFFRLSNVKSCKDIRRRSYDITTHRPELILNNFKTHLGRMIGRMFGALYHYDPEFQGRSACTFHNQRDYIFYRHHRYQFRNTKKVTLRELGPRFTMKLQWLKNGAFEGDYEWTLKRHEVEINRRKFQL